MSRVKMSLSSLGWFSSLEESLPINYFRSSVKEVEKRDNPFNKRRRVLIASKWSRKSSSSSSFYTLPNPKSMSLQTLNEDENKDESSDHKGEDQQESGYQSSSDEKDKLTMRIAAPNKKFLDKRLKSFKSQSWSCLADLHEEDLIKQLGQQ